MKTSRLVRYFPLVLLFIGIWSFHAIGQSIYNATYSPTFDRLEVMLDEKVNGRILNVYILNTKTSQLSTITSYSFPRDFIVSIDSPFRDFIGAQSPQDVFEESKKYFKENPILITLIIKAADGKTEVKAVSSSINQTTTVPATPPAEKVATNRDDAQIYLSGESVTAVGSKPQFSVDVKYDHSKLINEHYRVHIGPVLSYKGSTNPKADPDQLLAGLRFFGNADPSSGPCKVLCFTLWEAGGQLETNRRFTVKNLLTTERATFYFHPIPLTTNDDSDIKKEIRMQVAPFIGDEVGRNLSSPVKRTEKDIVRLLGGANVNLSFPTSNFLKKYFHLGNGVLWETSFTQRWYLKPELAYDKGDNGSLVLKNFGRAPHSYVSSKFSFLFNDYIAPTLTYEWGDLPPLYNRLKHKIDFGLTFMMTTKYP